MKKLLGVLLMLTACGDDSSSDFNDFDAPVQMRDAALPDSMALAPDAQIDAHQDPSFIDAGLFIPDNNCRITITGDTASGVANQTIEVLEGDDGEDPTRFVALQAFYVLNKNTTEVACGPSEFTVPDDMGNQETLKNIGIGATVPGRIHEVALPFTMMDMIMIGNQVVMTYQPDKDTVWSTRGAGGSITVTFTDARRGERVSPAGNYDNEIKATGHGVLKPARGAAQGTVTMDIVFF